MIFRRHQPFIHFCLLLLLGFFHMQAAQATDFDSVKRLAKGQTVYFNAWGGDAKINSYISWAGDILQQRHEINLVHVKLTDTASAVSRLLAEKTAGRDTGGAVGFVWGHGGTGCLWGSRRR